MKEKKKQKWENKLLPGLNCFHASPNIRLPEIDTEIVALQKSPSGSRGRGRGGGGLGRGFKIFQRKGQQGRNTTRNPELRTG